MNEKIQEALNRHLNSEFYSAYLYLSMSAHFDSIHFKGFAHWTKVQADEEMTHAIKVYNYILERGGTIVLLPIEGPPARWDSVLSAFESAYKHEQQVTTQINNLFAQCVECKDYATQIFLQWFVTEQVEEEAITKELVERLKLAKDANNSLFILDAEVDKRATA